MLCDFDGILIGFSWVFKFLLARLGYRQELKRNWSFLHNFGVSLSIISVLTMFVALAMAENVSAVPTSRGPYFWAAFLVSPSKSAVAAWITGW